MSFNTLNYTEQGGATSVDAGTRTVSGLLNVTGTFQMGGVATKFAAGTAAMGTVGSVVIATGLTTVTGFSANIYGTATPGTLTSILTPSFGSAGTVTVYGWKVTAAGTATLVASADACVVSFTAIGT